MSTIVIAEDDKLTGHVYASILRKAGFEVAVASDGESFVSLVAEVMPDAVLVDIMMPGGGGIAAIMKLREMGMAIPAVVITNAFVPEFIEHARAAGACEVLDKSSLTPAHLTGVLRTAVEREAKSRAGFF